MRNVLGTAAELLLWPFGIRRRRNAAGEEEEGGRWEVDLAHFFGASAGCALGLWALGRLKSSSGPAAIGNGSAAGTAAAAVFPPPRLPLSEFLKLLQAGAVTAVTYLADRPPAGALFVKTNTPLQLPTSLPAAAEPALHAETLLLPGCHEQLFRELRAAPGLRFECGELFEESADLSKLSLLLDVGGLAVSLACVLYLIYGTGNNGGGVGKQLESGAQAERARPAVTFDDVAGMEQTKEELREVISFLQNPGSFYALGARPPRGILMAGPSGTGKTLLARAVAGEAQVPFLYASSAAFVEVYVGQGAQRVRQFYQEARASAPCIVFLDEIDALGSQRTAASSGGNQEYAQTLNQLLLELDGIESATNAASSGEVDASQFVVTMAATNRYDCLDEALVRPGRIDRVVMVRLPQFAERVATLKIHARKLCSRDLDFEALARRTEGSSGADLAALLNDAALLAARRRADAVSMDHVMEVMASARPKQQRSQMPSAEESLRQGVSPELLAQFLASAMSGLERAEQVCD